MVYQILPYISTYTILTTIKTHINKTVVGTTETKKIRVKNNQDRLRYHC